MKLEESCYLKVCKVCSDFKNKVSFHISTEHYCVIMPLVTCLQLLDVLVVSLLLVASLKYTSKACDQLDRKAKQTVRFFFHTTF